VATCWRCGVEFDQSPFPKTYPCIDCQEELPPPPPGPFGRPQTPTKPLTPGLRAEREMAIWNLWKLNKNDQQIARELGISDVTVFRYRKKLGLAARSRGGNGTPEAIKNMRAGYKRYRERLQMQSPDATLTTSDNIEERHEQPDAGK
jgi:hypothetical protein